MKTRLDEILESYEANSRLANEKHLAQQNAAKRYLEEFSTLHLSIIQPAIADVSAGIAARGHKFRIDAVKEFAGEWRSVVSIYFGQDDQDLAHSKLFSTPRLWFCCDAQLQTLAVHAHSIDGSKTKAFMVMRSVTAQAVQDLILDRLLEMILRL